MRVKPHLIIRTLKQQGSIARTAHVLGIHPTTVWRWKKRSLLIHRRLSERKMFRLSTRPNHTMSPRLSAEEQTAIITLRNAHGYESQKIKKVLKLSVSLSTIHRLLKRKGLVRQYGYHLRPYYQKTTHMHARNTATIGYLQMDVKYLTPELTGLPWTCFEYGIIDIFSRYKEAVILNQHDQDGAILALTEILSRLPFTPTFIQTDNGLEFQERFHQIVLAKGLTHHYVHKSTPNENAVIERSFRTDEDEFFYFKYHGATDYDDLRVQFAAFLHFYNHERPHLGINLQTPLEVVAHVMKD